MPASRGTYFNDEGAARAHLVSVLRRDARPTLQGVAAPTDRPLLEDWVLQGVSELPSVQTRLVRFAQTKDRVPIFGAQMAVEIDRERNLVSIEGDLVEPPELSSNTRISEAAALEAIAALVKRPVAEIARPGRKLFFQHDKAWHLVWYFERVPAAPPGFVERAMHRHGESRGHGMVGTPRARFLELNYFIDACSGDVLHCMSAVPMIAKCSGIDEHDTLRHFLALKVGSVFHLEDALRGIKTYDLGFEEVGSTLPDTAATSTDGSWTDRRALVSAHANASDVMSFLEGVLSRNGIDDKGMPFVSVVNCVSRQDDEPRQWRNAMWWRNRMWYGQIEEGNRLRSYARHLDITAHEIMHGVTENTAGLIYENQPGALNESFSDIFGVIVNNLRPTPRPLEQWSWTIGHNIAGDGKPLRDLSDPTRTGDPAHMDDYVRTYFDNGGVHTNSNIHNKAAYNVLTSRNAVGGWLFKPEDVALLYYLALSRLPPVSDFRRALAALHDVARAYFAADAPMQEAASKAILKAYADVGIEM